MTQLDQLHSAIFILQSDVNALSVDQPAAFAKLQGSIAALKQTLVEANQPKAILLVAGVLSAPLGSVSLPITLIPGGFLPTAVQADFVFPASITFVSATLGPIPAGLGKSIQTSMVGSAVRVIVFGLNQSVITDGLDFTLNFKTTLKGQFPIVLQNPVASDANGNTLPLCLTSGIIGVL